MFMEANQDAAHSFTCFKLSGFKINPATSNVPLLHLNVQVNTLKCRINNFRG